MKRSILKMAILIAYYFNCPLLTEFNRIVKSETISSTIVVYTNVVRTFVS